jgi:putative membrane protein
MSKGIRAITGEMKRRGPGLYLRGLAMGAADVVPGVSGGTVAFITGIYDELVGTLAGVNAGLVSRLLRGRLVEVATGINAGFLLPLLAGVATAIFSLARLIHYLFEFHPQPIWGLLTGLMVASVIVVARRIDGWGLSAFVAVALGLAAGYGLAVAIPTQTGPELYKFVLSGAVASVAMILPGISGSLLLLMMGKYQQVLDAVHELDFVLLIVFGLGFVAGILTFSRLLKWLLASYHTVTMALLVGLMAGSIRKVWPFRGVVPLEQEAGEAVGLPVQAELVMPAELSTEVVVSLLLMVVGVIAVILLEKRHGGGHES